MYTPSDTRLEWLGEGLLFKLDTNKCLRAKMRPRFESFSGPLLKSGVGPLARYGNHREIVSRRLEQMCTSSYARLKWPGEGHYSSRSQINARGPKRGHYSESPPRPLLKSGLQPLFRYGTHQTISGRLGQVYPPSDPRLECPGEGPLFELSLNKCWSQNVRPGALGHLRHQCKSLSYVAEYVYQIC